MSSYPTAMPTHASHGGYQPEPSNGLGVAGFIVSLTGLVICGGFICPVGVLLSLFALGKAPRGFAIAGLITGLLGTVLAVFVVLAMVGAIGAGSAWMNAFGGQIGTSMTMDSARWDIDSHYDNNNDTLPDQATGDSIVGQYADDWGTALKYQPVAGSTDDYEIISAGADMQFNTGDDIVQSYNAAFGSGFGNATTSQDPFGNEGPNDAQIRYAFERAAELISSSYPAGSPLPDEQTGNALIKDLPDPWNGELRYAPTTSPTLYHLKSAGPDHQWLTEDDIVKSFFFAPGD